MYYGIYASVRGSAWKCLNDFGIASLPTDVMKIAKSAHIRMVKNSDIGALEGDELARTVAIDDMLTIIYDDQAPTESIRYSISHELGHIFLGHETAKIKYSNSRTFKQTAAAEKQADSFAVRLLCPACIIWALGLDSPEEIAELCRVDLSVAKSRHERMKLLKGRNKFLTDPSEKELFERFRNYIDTTLENRKEG